VGQEGTGGGGGVVEFDGRLDGLDAIGVAVQFAVRHRSGQRSEVSGRWAAPAPVPSPAQ